MRAESLQEEVEWTSVGWCEVQSRAGNSAFAPAPVAAAASALRGGRPPHSTLRRAPLPPRGLRWARGTKLQPMPSRGPGQPPGAQHRSNPLGHQSTCEGVMAASPKASTKSRRPCLQGRDREVQGRRTQWPYSASPPSRLAISTTCAATSRMPRQPLPLLINPTACLFSPPFLPRPPPTLAKPPSVPGA